VVALEGGARARWSRGEPPADMRAHIDVGGREAVPGDVVAPPTRRPPALSIAVSNEP
jgi:hypothetical protein